MKEKAFLNMHRCQNIPEINEQWKNKDKSINPDKIKLIEIDSLREQYQET